MIDYLESYLRDLNYQLGCGLDTLNAMTSGTPEFKNPEEAKRYLFQLEHYIVGLKIDDNKRRNKRLESTRQELEDAMRVL